MTKKVKVCPQCGNDDLNDYWRNGRKLQQSCSECDWKGEERTPEKQRIVFTKKVMTGQFGGWHYEIYDQYGHVTTYSKTYSERSKALEELTKHIEQQEKSPNCGPCTAILWPPFVIVKGEKNPHKQQKNENEA